VQQILLPVNEVIQLLDRKYTFSQSKVCLLEIAGPSYTVQCVH
jgi:hypothetical protein